MKKTSCLLLRFLYVCFLSFSVLAVCSKSSFLYPMNDWVDVNCFFTVGRGILHGLVPYRDLYEQKGPLVYFLFALASQISESSFLGIFLLEGVFYACFLHIGGRLAEMLSDSKTMYWPAAAVLAVILPFTPAFFHGSGSEEFFLPVLALGLWITLKAIHENRPLTDGQGFVLGLCAAAALWSKYTFCGLFAGLALAVIFWYLFTGKQRLMRLIGFFLLGCLVLSAGVVIWFARKGAVSDLLQVYFVDNLTRYPQHFTRHHFILPLKIFWDNPSWAAADALGLIWMAVSVKKRGWEALAVWLSAGCLYVFTYINGRIIPYYALILAVFAPLGVAALGVLIRRLTQRVQPRARAVAAKSLAAVLLLANPWIAYQLSPNTYLMQVEKDEMPPYRFAEIIRQSEDQTLLNYGFLDGGFYFAAGVEPPKRFFCTLNIDLPEMKAALEESIQQGKTAFVVTRQKELEHSGNYRLVDQAELFFEDRIWTYYLYQRTEQGNSS